MLVACLVLLLLLVLFFAEGLELAVADLLDKDATQLGSPEAQVALDALKRNAAFFFAHRQVFVVAIITFVSLAMSYEAVDVPFIGRFESDTGVPFAFALAFTTFTVLWLCQVTPKQLAVINSEAFLGASLWVWRLIRLASRLKLPDPATDVVAFIASRSRFSRRRRLRPSAAALYSLNAQFKRVAIDSLEVEVEPLPDGSARVSKLFVVLFLGSAGELHGYVRTLSHFARTPTVTVIATARTTVPERVDELETWLSTALIGASAEARTIADEEVQASVAIVMGGTLAAWRLQRSSVGGSLPAAAGLGETAMAALVRFEAHLGAGGVDPNGWTEEISVPVRRAILVMRGDAARPTGALTVLDSGVATHSPGAQATAELAFAVPGTTFGITWVLGSAREAPAA